MALDRKKQKIFAKNAQSTDLGVVGSKNAGNPQYSTDIETLQSLTNWETGLRAQVSNSDAPYLQDQNSILYVITYQLAYLFQAGIAEWQVDTEYISGRSVVLRSGKIYIAIANSTGVEPEVTSGWESSWKSLIDWGFLTGSITKQTDLWNTLLKGLSYNVSIATSIGGYPKGARLLFCQQDGYRPYIESLKDSNQDEPTDDNVFIFPDTYTYMNIAFVAPIKTMMPSASSFKDGDLVWLQNNENRYYNQIYTKSNGLLNYTGTIASMTSSQGKDVILYTRNTDNFYIYKQNQMDTSFLLSTEYSWIKR